MSIWKIKKFFSKLNENLAWADGLIPLRQIFGKIRTRENFVILNWITSF